MITFKVTRMISDSQTGIVKEIDYIAKGSIGESVGSLSLELPEGDYIPFAELTPTIVQSWVESKNLYNPADIDDENTQSSISTDLPW